MKKKKFIYAFLAALSSLSCMSFASGESDQEKFNDEVSKLGSNFDKDKELGDKSSNFTFSNSLSEEDQEKFKPYVIKQSSGLLELSKDIYTVYPIKNTVVDPTNPPVITNPGVGGGSTDLPYQPPVNGNLPGHPSTTGATLLSDEELEENQKKVDFVNSNIDLMNDLSNSGYGSIDDDGTFEITDTNDYIQQSFIMDFRLGWFEMDFTVNYQGSVIFGTLGILINVGEIQSFQDFADDSSTDIYQAFCDITPDALGELSSFIDNEWLSVASKIASTSSMVLDVLESSGPWGWVVYVAQYVLSHYVPSLVKGIFMVLGGYLFNYGTDVGIGLWWSNYNILSYSVY